MAKLNKTGQQEKSESAPTGSSVVMTPKLLDFAEVASDAQPTKIESSPMFMLKMHPERWHVSAGRIVPLCGKFKVRAGISGVSYEERTKRWDYRSAMAAQQARGWVLIPWDIDGAGTTYVMQPQGRPDVHLTKWERVYSGSTAIDSDSAGFAAWLDGHVKAGRLPSCPGYVLERMKANAERRINEIKDRVLSVPSLQPELNQQVADLAVLDAAIAQLPRGQVAHTVPAPSLSLD